MKVCKATVDGQLINFCLVMIFFKLFNGFDLLEMSKVAKKQSNSWICFSL